MSPTSPYIGARPFRRNEKIYGRAREARDLLSLLVGDRIVLLNSPSGAGKTSLIESALIPRLEQRRFAVRPTIRVGAPPPLPGVNRYLLSMIQSLEDARPAAEQLPPEQLAQLSLDEYLTQRCSQGAENGQVLIFDQFEEVLTLAPNEEQARVEFFTQLGDALADPWRWALFAIREEYVAALEHYANLVPTRFANTFRLDLLGVEAAAEAIRGPAQSMGVTFGEGVAEGLSRDLAKIVVQDVAGQPVELVGISVEPVQLQVVCYRLWERRFGERSAEEVAGQTVSPDDVRALGSIDNALEEYYASGVARAAAAGQVRERAVRSWVDTQLITRQGFRSQVLAGNEASFGLNEVAVDGLTNTYLVREERRRGVTWLELAHDRLIAPVRANNARWFEQHLSPLQRQAELWAAQGQPESLLFRGDELADAETWAAANLDGLTADERLFLESCRAERARAEERARAAQRIRNLAVGASIAAVLAVIAAATAFGFYGQAEAKRVEADQQRGTAVANGQTAVANEQLAQAQKATAESSSRVSTAREIAAAAKTQLGVDPELSILLGLRAVDATRPGDPEVAEAVDALQQAVQASRVHMMLHPGETRCYDVTYSPDGRMIAAVGRSNTLHLFDATSTNEIAQEQLGENTYLMAVDFSPDGQTLIAGGEDGVLYRYRVTDAQSLEPLEPSSPFDALVYDLQYSPDGVWIAIFLYDGTVHIVDSATLTPQIQPLPADITALNVAFSPDSTQIAIPAFDDNKSSVIIWKVADGSQVLRVEAAPNTRMMAVTFSSDGRWIATGGTGQRAQIWSLPDGALLHEYLAHTDSVFTLAFGYDDAYLITGSNDTTIKVWDIVNERVLHTFAAHKNLVRSISVRHDGMMLASASSDASIRQWSLSLLQSQPLYQAVYSPDGKMIATTGEDGMVQFWDAADGRRLRTLAGHDSPVNTIAFSLDAQHLISADLEGVVLIWDLSADSQPQQLIGHTQAVYAAALNPHEPLAATASEDATVRLWDILSQTEVYSFTNTAAFNSVAFSPDGTLLAAGDSVGNVTIWKVSNGEVLTELEQPSKSRVLAVAFSPDGTRLAMVGDDQTGYIFPLAGGDPIPLTGHAGPINAVAFSHSGDRIATASSDDTVRLWDAASGIPDPYVLHNSTDPFGLSFSPDDSRLAVVTVGSAEAHIYPLSLKGLIDLAQARLTRTFSAQECTVYAIPSPCP